MKYYDRKIIGVLGLICYFFATKCFGQPIPCDGSLFLCLTNGGNSVFYGVGLENNGVEVSFTPFSMQDAGISINAIGYSG